MPEISNMIKSVYLLPHGGIIVPGMEKSTNEKATVLHQAMLDIQKEIQRDNIELIILTSPHGYSHPTDYLIYFNQLYEAFHYVHDDKGKLQTINQLMWRGHVGVASLLLKQMNVEGFRVNPFIQGDVDYPLKLSWGESIPLSYLCPQESGPAAIIFALPSLLQSTPDFQTQLIRLGESIYRMSQLDQIREIRTSVIISGDLSHRHDKNHSYGFDETSKTFDEMTLEWVVSPTREQLFELFQLDITANSCSIQGMAIIQGILESMNGNWIPPSPVYACPTYFGMVVAGWISIE
ncbi:MAG: DODA-type extradiol aromatic ring-opening family dioxygenase [Candidatus Kariarchaeaceae archaeon]|jgi:aromatic ring-opening dioxygenase LigB subunit